MTKYKNTETSIPCGIALNDKDYLTNLLSTLKEMSKNYTIALTEASNEILYTYLLEIALKVSNMQREIFELLFQNGCYEIESIKAGAVKKSLKKINELYQNQS